MAEKILNTRIQLKYDTLANWNSSSITLKKGEIALATIDTANPANKELPPVMFKVGDGEKTFSQLTWASALAADVYGWAKQNAITVSKAGTGNVVASIEWDATLNEGKGGIKYTTAAVATAEGMGELQEALGALTEKVNGMYTNDQIDTAVAGAKTYADEKVAALSADGGAIKAVADGLADLKAKVEDEEGALARANEAYNLADAAQTADEVSTAITNAINDLDSTASQTAGADGLALSVTQVDGKVTAISGSIAANTYDAYGAATTVKSEVIGTSGDATTADTIYGAKAAAQAAQNKADEVGETLDKFLDGITPDGSEAIKDTLKEISDYITEDTEAFTQLSGRVGTLEAKPGLDKVGTVTKVTAGDGLDGGDITETGTIALNAATKASLAKADTALQAADITGKADKVSGATNGNFAGLDANGNLTDSGKKATDFEAAGAAAALQEDLVNGEIEVATALNAVIADEAGIATSVKDDSIETSSIIDKAVTTAKIADEAVGLAQLAESVQDSISLANSSLQEITTTANGGLKVTNKNQIDIDDSITFVFDCGTSVEGVSLN